MSGVTELAYIGVEAGDLMAWKSFAVDLMGMQLATQSDDALSFRMDGKAHRWIIQRGPADDLAFTGFDCGTSANLDALVARLRDAGSEVAEGDAAIAAARRVQRIAITRDPLGNRVELVAGLADADHPFASGTLKSAFVTGNGGAGHQVLIEHGEDRQRIMAWYSLIGFKLTDVIEEDLAPGVTASVAFLHCNPRHHTLALANMPFPKRVHHFMVEVADMSDVGHAYDRCLDARQPLEMTLGMHPNDKMFSFYARSPSGFSIEFGWGGLLIDEAAWQVQHLDKLSAWGHRPPQVVSDLLV